ncbi:MAG TPA: asparagine synthase (glutamine-hydrolyzing) [Chitinophagaceae bacterium]|nr:asparagine synthase (glutamine-hydrolyzing) [Chitinophagaceae bacterium]
MCSIAGIISPDPDQVVPAILEQMNQTLEHRGPDGKGYYIHQQSGIHTGFAHNRLSILDLSGAAAQPLKYLDRYVLVFNGEIYNYREIRDILKSRGYHFQSTGDTEVVAAAFDAFGTECLEHFDGMFSFAIWDEKNCRLFCARDRFGEKPFYYHYNEDQNCLHFASEMKALFAAGIEKSADPVMLYNYLTLGFTKRPDQPGKTFFLNVHQLTPAHFLLFEPLQGQPLINRYWDLDKETRIEKDDAEAVGDFTRLLANSVSRRMRSDVPIGTSLSGGLDSSSIIAVARDVAEEQYSHKAFSAIFPGYEKDESARIRSMADAYQLQLYTVSPDADLFAEQLQAVINAQEEPFGSASVFAQYMVFAKAKEQGVKVLLDGQGADEVLAGYSKYTHWYLQELIQSEGWEKADSGAGKFRENGFLPDWGWKNRLATMFPAVAANQLEKKAIRSQRSNGYFNHEFAERASDSRSIYKPTVEKLNDIQYHDIMVMGLEELLRYADRNSMAHGREVRLPFLSHELVQFVFSLPSSFRMRDGYTKWILRKMMDKKIPSEICWQKGKIGFEPPQKQWMQQPAFQGLLHDARKNLVNKNICHQNLIKKPIIPAEAHGADNFDFRTLIAGMWINLY